MATAAQYQAHAAQLVDPTKTPEARKEIIVRIRESVDGLNAQSAPAFIDAYFPAFKSVLTTIVKPQDFDNVLNQCRIIILEILAKILHHEAVRPRYTDLMFMVMDVLSNDNEENGFAAIHIVFDMYRNYRKYLTSQTTMVLEFAQRLYQAFPRVIERMLLRRPQIAGHGSGRRIPPAKESFKILIECPLLVMFVLQILQANAKDTAQTLLPLLIRLIDYDIPAKLMPAVQKPSFIQLIKVQTKTISVLTYVLKQDSFKSLKFDGAAVPRATVKLLQKCPADIVPLRRELLVAVKHMVGTPYRQGFFSQLDALLDPKTLIGVDKGASESVRSVAYSFLAELIHWVRLNLTLAQTEKAITIFSANLHDPTLSYSTQTLSVRLLLNLIEGILKVDSNDVKHHLAARELLQRILETMVTKYCTLGTQVPKLLETVEEYRKKPDPTLPTTKMCDVSSVDPFRVIAEYKTLLKALTLGLKTLLWSAINVRATNPGLGKQILNTAEKSGVAGSASVAAGRPGVRVGLSEQECEIVSRLLDAGKDCFRLFKSRGPSPKLPHISEDKDGRIGGGDTETRMIEEERDEIEKELSHLGLPWSKNVVASDQEEKEVIDHYAQIFTVLDVRSFQDIFGIRMSDLFDQIVDNPAMVAIPQHLLANNNISKYFADILLNFLIDSLHLFDTPIPMKSPSEMTREEKASQCFLKLFKILFASVSLFAANEPVLRMHIGSVVRKCLRLAISARDPQNYLQMLRALFKVLTGSKGDIQFELLYRDIMPLVEPLFNGLLALYEGPNRLGHGDLIVELCLMIPARPSTIFPYLELQIKPILWALESGKENAHYGLRTLEFWIDMLQPAYLEALLAKIEPDLMRALFRLLNPPFAVPFGAVSIKILGKLGHRARSNRVNRVNFRPRDTLEVAQEVPLRWVDGSQLLLKTDELIQLQVDALMCKRVIGNDYLSNDHKIQAWRFLYVCLSFFLGITDHDKSSEMTDISTTTSCTPWSVMSNGGVTEAKIPNFDPSLYPAKARIDVSKRIIVALVGASGDPLFKKTFEENPDAFGDIGNPADRVSDLARYFAIITVQNRTRFSVEGRGHTQPISSYAKKEASMVPQRLFLDSIPEILCHKEASFREGGLFCLRQFVRSLRAYALTVEMSQIIAKSKEVDAAKANAIAESNPNAALGNNQDASSQDKNAGNSLKTASSKQGLTKDNEVKPDVVKMEDISKKPGANLGARRTGDEQVLATSLYELVDRLCHCCFKRTWNAKLAGTSGLESVVSIISPETLKGPSFATCILHMIRALSFVMRDSPENAEDDTVKTTRSLLHRLLRECFLPSTKGSDYAKSFQHPTWKVAHDVTLRFALELISDNVNTRKSARECLGILSETFGVSVADLLHPMKDKLLKPLAIRSIRHHNFPQQIGYVEAVNFCLQLPKPLISEEIFKPPLRNTVLQEVITVSGDTAMEKITEGEENMRSRLIENKLVQNHIVKHIAKLRRHSVELLCTVATNCPEQLKKKENEEIYTRIISRFFSNLQSRDSNIVKSAKEGLRKAIMLHPNPKPKVLLQQHLRPILAQLGDYKKLTILYLQGLKRVLELFSNWFNVNLGDKLLEHLEQWTEPEKIAQLKRWTPGTEARVGAAILELFHLLPPKASKFLDKIVPIVIKLESVASVASPGSAHLGLKSAKAASTSPYREPLLKYCNKHASSSATYFLTKLEDCVVRQIFFVMIRAPESEALRKELMGNPKRLVVPQNLSSEGTGKRSLHIITLMNILSQHQPEWLASEPELISKLAMYWKGVSGLNSPHHSVSNLSRVKEVKIIAGIFIRYLKKFPNEIPVLFELLRVFSNRTIYDFTFVKEFLAKCVTSIEFYQFRHLAMKKFFEVFEDEKVEQERKVNALRYILIPMLTHHLSERKKLLRERIIQRGTLRTTKHERVPPNTTNASGTQLASAINSKDGKESTGDKAGSKTSTERQALHGGENSQSGSSKRPSLSQMKQSQSNSGTTERSEAYVGVPSIPPDPFLNQAVIFKIVKDLLDRPDEILRWYEDSLSAELLRLTTLLIQNVPHALGRFKKELIKFGWNHLKRDDPVAKHLAFINVTTFFKAYQAPGKIVLQVYVALLRATQHEGKTMTHEALDILAPLLPARLAHAYAEHKYPIWVRYTKKVLLEESHSLSTQAHIFQHISRHPDLFYRTRSNFFPLMITLLSKITANAQSAAEYRRPTLDIIDLLMKWEEKRISDHKLRHDEVSSKDGEGNPSKKRKRSEEGPKDPSISQPSTKLLRNETSAAVPTGAGAVANLMAANKEANEYKPTPANTEVIVNHLVNTVFRPMDRREMPSIVRRCFLLLRKASQLWPLITVKLSFAEKVILSISPDKPSIGKQGPSSAKISSASNQENSGNDSRQASKTDAASLEKEEQSRLRRNAARSALIGTVLSLASTLTKSQGKKFVRDNLGVIRSCIKPAITEANVSHAKQFASLLRAVFEVYPISNDSSRITTAALSSSSKPATKSTTNSANPTNLKAPQEPQKTPNITTKPQNALQSSNHIPILIYKAVIESIDLCLTTQDPVRNHCGLVVLKAVTEVAPSNVLKYHEVITKIMTRIVKELIHISQQAQQAGSAAASSSHGLKSAASIRSPSGFDRNPALSAQVGNGVRMTNGTHGTGAGSLGNDSASHIESNRGKKLAADEAAARRLRHSQHQSLLLCVSILEQGLTSFETQQKKPFFHLLWALLERGNQFELLREIVRTISKWVLWKGKSENNQKEPLQNRDKVIFLTKMVNFDRHSGEGSQELLRDFFNLILEVFSGENRRTEITSKLEKAFMLGMKSEDESMRRKFFDIYDKSMSRFLPVRFLHVIGKQDWEFLADRLWIKHASEFILAAAEKNSMPSDVSCTGIFPQIAANDFSLEKHLAPDKIDAIKRTDGLKVLLNGRPTVLDEQLDRFLQHQKRLNIGSLLEPLKSLLHLDSKMAVQVWTELAPKVWQVLNQSDRSAVEKALPVLLTKEYHQIQAQWPVNNVRALLGGLVQFDPLPSIRADLLFHLGSRWGAWHTVLRYFDLRDGALRVKQEMADRQQDERLNTMYTSEREDIAVARAAIFRQLNEQDLFCGLWKAKAKSVYTTEGLCFEQTGQFVEAQEAYAEAMAVELRDRSPETIVSNSRPSSQPNQNEVCLWEERWVECARNLGQWDALKEFGRVTINSDVLHECLWRVPNWSALKDLLIKNPVEDGPQLKLYQAFVQLQENCLDVAETFIMQGYQRALDRFCILPESADFDSSRRLLVQFQQLVELQESGRILGELNALSRHGTCTVNVDQKIDTVRVVLNTWRERLPSPHEPLVMWSDILTWRNHVHAVVVNVLDALKEAANAKVAAGAKAAQQSQNVPNTPNRSHSAGLQTQPDISQVQAAAAIAQALPQQVLVMGINETAWNVHRLAKTCRKQGYPSMALHILHTCYPFGTMELNEYFVKSKETARCFIAKPPDIPDSLENGVKELNKTNMDHFNARQKAQLFTIRSKLCFELGKDNEAVESLSVALSTSCDVGSAWLTWALHCDKVQKAFSKSRTQTPSSTGGRVPEPQNNGGVDNMATALTWREAAVNCFLQAARFGSRKSRFYFARVLRLLTLDLDEREERNRLGKTETSNSKVKKNVLDELASVAKSSKSSIASAQNDSTGTPDPACDLPLKEGCAKVISTLRNDLPAWLWLPWIPQLIAMLGRKEALVVRPILAQIGTLYPQAIFFHIRAYMEERKGIDKPDRVYTKEAVKSGRSAITSFLGHPTGDQLTAARQLQAVKERLKHAERQFVQVKSLIDTNEKAIAESQGSAEQAQHLVKQQSLQEQLVQAHRQLEKVMRDRTIAEQRQKQAYHNASNANPSPTSAPATPQNEKGSNTPGSSATPQSNNQKKLSESQSGDSRASGSTEGNKSSAKVSNVSSGDGKMEVVVEKSASARITPFSHADQIMSYMVKSHGSLYSEIDRVALELSLRMKPQREEHLLSLMNALLSRCYQYKLVRTEVAPSFKSALEEVSKMCFSTGSESRNVLPASVADLKTRFEAELAPQTAKDFPTSVEELVPRLRRWQAIFQRRVDGMPDLMRLEHISRHLLDMNASEVEIFGQYNAAEVSEPSIDQHIKIARFSADVRTIKGHSSVARGLEVIGSDGRSYHYMLETGLSPSMQWTEEKTVQLMRLLNTIILAKDSQSYRRRIQLTLPTLVPTGQRTRLVSDDPKYNSLTGIMEQFTKMRCLKTKGKRPEDSVTLFRRVASEILNNKKSNPDDEHTRAEAVLARMEAYRIICESHVPPTIVKQVLRAKMPNLDHEFSFRKRLAENWGTTSMIVYLLSITGRRPQNVLISWENAGVYLQHIRGLLSKRGIVENEETVPFRLTRNILKAMGEFGLSGPFYGNAATTLNAMNKNEKLVGMFLELIVYDEIASWVGSRAVGGKLGAEDMQRRRETRLEVSGQSLMRRMKGLLRNSGSGATETVEKKGREVVELLVKAATRRENLAQMDSTWMAWY